MSHRQTVDPGGPDGSNPPCRYPRVSTVSAAVDGFHRTRRPGRLSSHRKTRWLFGPTSHQSSGLATRVPEHSLIASQSSQRVLLFSGYTVRDGKIGCLYLVDTVARIGTD